MNLDHSFNAACNSAKALCQLNRNLEAQERAENRHKATLEAGAKASVEQQKLLEQEIELLKVQNVQLSDNYDKLKEMYDRQVREADEAQKDLKKSRHFNAWAMVVSVISMIAAVASVIIAVLE